MPHDTGPDETSTPFGAHVMGRHAEAAPYQSTQLTSRPPERLLDELSALDVTGVRVAERGPTYIVFAPVERHAYTTSLAVTLAIILAIGVLVATAWAVVLIALLPLALLPFVPLLLADRPQVAAGAVPGENGSTATRVTVHGRVWGDLRAALDAYLTHLPPAEAAAPRRGVAATVPRADGSGTTGVG